jgi:hypothetical protein
MQLMAGGKRLRNPDFWFAAIWLLLEDGRIPYLHDMLPFVREHMIFRLRESMAHTSLTGLPGFINYSVPLGVACWVSLCSPAFPGITLPPVVPPHAHESISHFLTILGI